MRKENLIIKILSPFFGSALTHVIWICRQKKWEGICRIWEGDWKNMRELLWKIYSEILVPSSEKHTHVQENEETWNIGEKKKVREDGRG